VLGGLQRLLFLFETNIANGKLYVFVLQKYDFVDFSLSGPGCFSEPISLITNLMLSCSRSLMAQIFGSRIPQEIVLIADGELNDFVLQND